MQSCPGGRAVADTLARTIGAVFPCHLALGFEIGEVSAIQMRRCALPPRKTCEEPGPIKLKRPKRLFEN